MICRRLYVRIVLHIFLYKSEFKIKLKNYNENSNDIFISKCCIKFIPLNSSIIIFKCTCLEVDGYLPLRCSNDFHIISPNSSLLIPFLSATLKKS